MSIEAHNLDIVCTVKFSSHYLMANDGFVLIKVFVWVSAKNFLFEFLDNHASHFTSGFGKWKNYEE